MSDELARQFVAVLRRHLPMVDEDRSFPMDTDFEDLGLESVSAITMLLDLEETLGVVFPDAMLTEETFQSASTLERAVRRLRGSAG